MVPFKGNVERINRPSPPSSALKPHSRQSSEGAACALHFKSSPLCGHRHRSVAPAQGPLVGRVPPSWASVMGTQLSAWTASTTQCAEPRINIRPLSWSIFLDSSPNTQDKEGASVSEVTVWPVLNAR